MSTVAAVETGALLATIAASVSANKILKTDRLLAKEARAVWRTGNEHRPSFRPVRLPAEKLSNNVFIKFKSRDDTVKNRDIEGETVALFLETSNAEFPIKDQIRFVPSDRFGVEAAVLSRNLDLYLRVRTRASTQQVERVVLNA